MIVAAACLLLFAGCEQPVAKAEAAGKAPVAISGTVKSITHNFCDGNHIYITVEFDDGRLLLTKYDKPLVFKLNAVNKIYIDDWWSKIKDVEIP